MAVADDFQAVLDTPPPDWTQLELDLRIWDETATSTWPLLVQINAMPYSQHDWHWRLRARASSARRRRADRARHAGADRRPGHRGRAGAARGAQRGAEVTQMWGAGVGAPGVPPAARAVGSALVALYLPDLLFGSKVEGARRAAGHEVVPSGDAEAAVVDLTEGEADPPEGVPTVPTTCTPTRTPASAPRPPATTWSSAPAHESRGGRAGGEAARGRIAVVTGASSGIGAATARLLAAQDWRVIGWHAAPNASSSWLDGVVALPADLSPTPTPGARTRGRRARGRGSSCSSTTRAPSGADVRRGRLRRTCARRWT